MLKNLLTFLQLVIVTLSYCQQYENPDRFFHRCSPTTYELGKYGSHPVDLYRGTVGIGIPLYNLNTFSLNLPLELSYNSSGIKVDDIASWVGLGWSLNAGGVITITQKGGSDLVCPRIRIKSDVELFNEAPPCNDTLLMIRAKSIDSEPDLYNYNFCGYSGQFVLDNNFNIINTKNSNGLAKISINKTNLNAIAIDNNGIIYHFDCIESTFTEYKYLGYYYTSNTILNSSGWISNNGDYDSIPTAFLLTKIENPNTGETIIFEYEDETTEYLTKPQGSVKTQKSMNGFVWEYIQDNAFTKEHILIYGKRIKRIWFDRDNVEIIFNSNTERTDLRNTKMLDEVIIKTNNSLVMKWKFNYDYFISSCSQVEEITGNNLHSRLRLTSIQKFGSDGQPSEPPYIFSYIGDNDPSKRMPYRTSFDGYDHWGYCNKYVNSSDACKASRLLPDVGYESWLERAFICLFSLRESDYPVPTNVTRVFDPGFPIPSFQHPRGDRNASEFCSVYTLSKIKYPTGGFTEFIYEPHRYNEGYDIAGGLRIKKMRSFNKKSYIENTFSYSVGKLDYLPNYIKAQIKQHYSSSDNKWQGNDILSCGSYDPHNNGLIQPDGYFLNTNSLTSNNSTNTDYITYLVVTDSTLIDGKMDSYTVTKYKSFEDVKFDYAIIYRQDDTEGLNTVYRGRVFMSSMPVYPFSCGNAAPSYLRGLKDCTIFYNKEGIKVKELDYTYTFANEKVVYGNQAHSEHAEIFWFISAYKLYGGKAFLSQIKTTNWDISGSNPNTLVEEYQYNTDYEIIKEEKKIGTSILTKKYTYPFDFKSSLNLTSAPGKMVNKNMNNYILETISLKDSLVIDATFTNYRFNGANIVKDYELKLAISDAINDFKPIKWNYGPSEFDCDSRYDTIISYNLYDQHGRLLEFRELKNEPVTILWSDRFSNSPVAKITNAKFKEVAYSSFETDNISFDMNYGNWKFVYGPEWDLSDVYKTGEFSANSIYTRSPIITYNIIPVGKYIISCWSSGGGIKFPFDAIPNTFYKGEWYYSEALIDNKTPQKLQIILSNAGRIDELRLYPWDAEMETYSYNRLNQLTSKSQNNLQLLQYLYDPSSRLIIEKDHNSYIRKHMLYQISNN